MEWTTGLGYDWIGDDERLVVDVMFTSTSGRAFQRGAVQERKILLGTAVVYGCNVYFATVTPGYGSNCKLKMW